MSSERNVQPTFITASQRSWSPHPNPAFQGVTVAFLGNYARLLRVEPGGQIAPHEHPGEWDFSYVLEGTGEATIGDAVLTVNTGDYFGVPPDTVHRVENQGSTELVILLHRFHD